MSNPYVWLPVNLRWPVVVALFAVSIILMIALSVIGKGLTVKEGDDSVSIMNIEMPWTQTEAETVVRIWKDKQQIDAAIKQTRLDFLFLLIYPAALSLACVMASGSQTGLMANVGGILSWAVLFCTPLDFTENVFILKMLDGALQTPIPQLTTFVSLIKWVLIAIASLYLLAGGVLKILHR